MWINPREIKAKYTKKGRSSGPKYWAPINGLFFSRFLSFIGVETQKKFALWMSINLTAEIGD